MKKIKEIQGGNIYVFQGKSNANSCFIEKVIHAKKFLIYANYFLKDYLSIYDYIITKNGWAIVVRINSSEILFGDNQMEDSEIWRIISERMRLFLSTFVRVTNKQKGRTGCLVHSKFERFEFESKKEALGFVTKIRKQKIKFYSRKKKYRALKTHYTIDVIRAKGSIFLCSKELRKEKNRMVEFRGVIDFADLRDLVREESCNFASNNNKFTNSP